MKISIVFALVLSLAALAAQAGEHGDKDAGENRGKPLQPAQTNAKWQQECGSCHTAFAPGLLPAASWRKIMVGLDKHFGTDASLNAAENREIAAWLVEHASNRWRASAAPLRITDTAWFQRKHDAHEISPAVWKRPAVKSRANCQACHAGADKGDFNEHRIRIPK